MNNLILWIWGLQSAPGNQLKCHQIPVPRHSIGWQHSMEVHSKKNYHYNETQHLYLHFFLHTKLSRCSSHASIFFFGFCCDLWRCKNKNAQRLSTFLVFRILFSILEMLILTAKNFTRDKRAQRMISSRTHKQASIYLIFLFHWSDCNT